MNIPGYYSTGQFAKKAHTTKKTLRYYDEHNILKPSYVTPYGARFYDDEDLARLQQILLFKYLGFSLDDIKQMTIASSKEKFVEDSLELQLKLVEDKIEQMQVVAQAIKDTSKAIQAKKSVDWSQMLHVVQEMTMEESLKKQYKNASNISARIKLHDIYGKNKGGWFPWIYDRSGMKTNQRILELGSGDGTFWKVNQDKLDASMDITITDLSEGMLRDAKNLLQTSIGNLPKITYKAVDAHEIPFGEANFDRVIANHVLFYCQDIDKVCREVRRVLKAEGQFIATTYSERHMKEISDLVQAFDDRIVLSSEKLYTRFGRENGGQILGRYFNQVEWVSFEDGLFVTDPEPLIAYVLSCHGNQNQYILDRYREFVAFVKKKTSKGFEISKEAGAFICKN